MFREDIVVVTVEYRSGILGFLSDGTKYMPGGCNSIFIVTTSSLIIKYHHITKYVSCGWTLV